jgi:DivIVA domain-containing protein
MATDIDLPFQPSSAQIRRREFASVRRGYDPDQVRDYLAQVAEQVENLEQDLRELKLQPGKGSRSEGSARPSDSSHPDDPYERLAKRLTTLLATADTEAEGILGEARADSARMIDEARSEADRIRVDAQARAEEARQQGNELLERAKQEADRVLLGLSERRETLVQHLQDMQTRLVGVAKELEVAIDDPEGAERSRSAGAEMQKAASEPGTSRVSASPPAPADAEHRAEPQAPDMDDQPADGIDGLEGMLTEDGIDMPGIPPLELDFDDDSGD